MHSSQHCILKPLNPGLASLLERQLSNSPDFSSLFFSSQSSLTSAGEHNNAFHRNQDLHSNPLLKGGGGGKLSQDIRSSGIHTSNIIKELYYCLLILQFQLLSVQETKNRFCATGIRVAFSDLNFCLAINKNWLNPYEY